MRGTPISVIVVSRDRPDDLALCLLSLSQQYHHPFEVIVVADPVTIAGLWDTPLSDKLKLVEFAEENISAARNAGLAQAAGEILAFIDDDAVAEPTWLEHLSAPFSDGDVSAVGGFVLGRNGLSLQWGARSIDGQGFHHDLPFSGGDWQCPDPGPGRAVKTEGTNSALRRSVLASLGGFDRGFRFFHDEADLNVRLARAGHRTAIAPRALVHHKSAASKRRTAERRPSDLFEIAASSALFARKHDPSGELDGTLAARRDEERKRLLQHMVRGSCEPRDVARLLGTFDAGVADGKTRSFQKERIADPAAAFLPMNEAPPERSHEILAGRSWQKRRLCRQARAIVSAGRGATVFCFSPTSLYHRVRYCPGGFWLQTGGLFGRSDRRQPVFRLFNLKIRVAEECRRLTDIRT
ncbi:MAG: glycosyltransferase [Rhodobacteraceae bacterium]|nr:glycosyltransferase [Paracoccaceae bacterium]